MVDKIKHDNSLLACPIKIIITHCDINVQLSLQGKMLIALAL